MVGSECLGSPNLPPGTGCVRGIIFSQKAPGILLGFSCGLERAFKVCLRFSIRHHQKLAAFRKL